MIKALVIKELREVYWIAAVALVLYLATVSALIGVEPFRRLAPTWRPQAPFAGETFVIPFALLSALFAVALGLRQSAWEGGHGLYLFLLHRPLRREAIFLTKLAAGAGLLLLCAAVPVLWYAAWAATPGHHPSPFSWSMTGQAWRLYLATPLLDLGAFLSGLRPAHWFGTRLLPLVAAAGGAVFLVVVPWWWLVGLPAAALLDAAFVVTICLVGRTRDYS
jgi:hypothetical protein